MIMMQVGVKCNTIKVGLDRAQWTYIYQSQGLVYFIYFYFFEKDWFSFSP